MLKKSLIILLLILGVSLVGAFIIPPIIGEHPRGCPRNVTCTQMSSIENVLEAFCMDNGTYPSTEEGLKALLSNPDIKKYPLYARTSYYKRLPKDAWGEAFYYRLNKGKKIELLSLGADKKRAGERRDADIIYPQCADKKEIGFFKRIFN